MARAPRLHRGYRSSILFTPTMFKNALEWEKGRVEKSQVSQPISVRFLFECAFEKVIQDMDLSDQFDRQEMLKNTPME